MGWTLLAYTYVLLVVGLIKNNIPYLSNAHEQVITLLVAKALLDAW